ncbi:hypothetical protein GCM10009525_41730 [Streptosporangium amethystogenes subsp. fukuiense]
MADYLNKASRIATGSGTAPVRLEDIPGRGNGVELEEVYTRPFHRLWTDLSDGKPIGQAVSLEAHRLGKSVAADLQLASRNTAHTVMQADDSIVGYKRTLSDRNNHCALCVVAATNTYSREDLLPIHPSCGCSVEPIYRSSDDSSFIDDEVSNAYKRALAKGTIAVTDHGEYGPYLQAA